MPSFSHHSVRAKTQDDSHSGSISPLGPDLHSGLLAMFIVGGISMLVTTALFLYLTWKLLAWRLSRGLFAERVARNMPAPPVGAEFTAEDMAFGPQGQDSKTAHENNLRRIEELKKPAPNQFLILVHNLLLADMLQALAITLSGYWVFEDAVTVGTPMCFIQGLFASNGDLASSCFITAIAIHTYCSVVVGYRPPHWALYSAIVFIWVFVVGFTSVPLAITRNGYDEGGYFVRVGAWCWVNQDYKVLRILTHYIFIFISFVVTTVLYTGIFFTLRRQGRKRARDDKPLIRTSHNPAFLVYPLIYLACTLPLAIARVLSMNGAEVPKQFWCFAGAAIASNGWCDVLVFGTTRHTIIFGSKAEVGAADTGLETFAFMRTPAGKRFGNVIWIEGGESALMRQHERGLRAGGWWRRTFYRDSLMMPDMPALTGDTGTGSGMKRTQSRKLRKARTLSQESLRSADGNDLAIQMDVVTTVAIEMNERAGSSAGRVSFSSVDKEYSKLY